MDCDNLYNNILWKCKSGGKSWRSLLSLTWILVWVSENDRVSNSASSVLQSRFVTDNHRVVQYLNSDSVGEQ